MKTNQDTDLATETCVQLLDGYFADCLRDFCIRETHNTDAGFRIYTKTLDMLRGMDADDMAYVINNRTIRAIVEQANGIGFSRD